MAGELSRRVGANIRARRLRQGLATQRELAEQMASPTISNQTVSDWERGVNKPSDDNLRELASILSCDVSDFYAESAAGQTPEPFAENGRSEPTQLDRIDAKLDRILALLTGQDAGVPPADVVNDVVGRLEEKAVSPPKQGTVRSRTSVATRRSKPA